MSSELVAELKTIMSALERVVQKLEQDDDQEEECAICLGSLGSEDVVPLNCDHKFHHACLSRWLQTNNTCPVCRARADTSVPTTVNSTMHYNPNSLFEEVPSDVDYLRLFGQQRYGHLRN